MIRQTIDTFTQDIYPAGNPLPADAEIYLTALATFRSLGNFKWEQVAEITAIHAVLEGAGTVLCNGQPFDARKGDIFIFREGGHYQYFDLPEAPWNYTYILISGHRIDELLDAIGFTMDRPVLNFSDSDRFWVQLNRLKQEFELEKISGLSAVRAGWEILELLKERCDPRTLPQQHDMAKTARQIVDLSPQTLTNVNALADALNVSRVTLFRCFKERYGLSIKEYIEQIRFNRIQNLLEASSLPLNEIARMGGFSDPLYFSRAFRKRFGMSPGQWRTDSQ